MTTTAATKSNRYAASCFECSQTVPANTGSLERFDGRWIVRHATCAAHAAAIDAVLEGNVRKVTPATGNEYGQAIANLDRKYWPFVDPSFGNALEMEMHAMEAYADRHEA